LIPILQLWWGLAVSVQKNNHNVCSYFSTRN
jgi:hypothetical protein